MKKDLSERQKLFVYEYLIDLNAEAAAIRAGYSERSAYSTGHDVKNHPLVAAAIQLQMDKRIAKTEITGEKVLKRLDDIGDVDIGDAYDDDNCLLPIKKMPVHIRKCISGIEVFERWTFVDDPESGRQKKIKEGEVVKVKWCDKVKSNELIGKNQKLFFDKIEITDNTNRADKLAKARKRVNKNV